MTAAAKTMAKRQCSSIMAAESEDTMCTTGGCCWSTGAKGACGACCTGGLGRGRDERQATLSRAEVRKYEGWRPGCSAARWLEVSIISKDGDARCAWLFLESAGK